MMKETYKLDRTGNYHVRITTVYASDGSCLGVAATRLPVKPRPRHIPLKSPKKRP